MTLPHSRKFLFVSAPLSGHLDWGGYLRTAAYLSHQGHDVLWVSEEPIRASVEASGVHFRAVGAIGWRWPDPQLPADLRPEQQAVVRFQRALLVMMSEDAVAHATEDLLAVIQEFDPDAIVGEPTIMAAAIASEQSGRPYAVCGYPATPPDRHVFSEAERVAAEEGAARLGSLFARFGVSGRNWPGGLSPWPQSPDLHIVYWTREWYADEKEILPQTQFVGGSAQPPDGDPPRWFDRLPPDAPLALITLGSLFTDDPNFFVLAAHACIRAGVFPIIAMGRSDRAPDLKQQIAPRLPRCVAVSWVDYDHLFPRLALAVHHGGMGTTHAAVVHSVPQVIVPHAADQGLQARRAEASGVGLALHPKEATLEAMQRTIEAVVRDPGFRIRARKLSGVFAAADGVGAAVQEIEKLVGRRRAAN